MSYLTDAEVIGLSNLEILDMKKLLEERLGDRGSVCAYGLASGASFADLSGYATADSVDPALADLSAELWDFAEAMQASADRLAGAVLLSA